MPPEATQRACVYFRFATEIGVALEGAVFELIIKQVIDFRHGMVVKKSITQKGLDMKNVYTPHPEEMEDITLPKELEELTEAMARNVHEVWAEKRIKEGWSYGQQRNDEKKKHPCLIPYEELPESEREYDKQTALQTLKLICKLGFEITKK